MPVCWPTDAFVSGGGTRNSGTTGCRQNRKTWVTCCSDVFQGIRSDAHLDVRRTGDYDGIQFIDPSQTKSKRSISSIGVRMLFQPDRVKHPLKKVSQRGGVDRENGRWLGSISYRSIIAVADPRSSVFEKEACRSFRPLGAFLRVPRLACAGSLHTLDLFVCMACTSPLSCLRKQHEAYRHRDD